ncbi:MULTISPECIES: hypothetical protein [Alteromonas]|uniref:hypothetical protein n=1 Tax=Alteromonas TaxID=226 RepID=UPI000770094B|nr:MULTISPECIES: hypothetical protein [Alteromonas]AMJ86151.1 hypothetical protein AV939_05870 [Alteromonas sp. Mac1]AMJ90010.1 hypothetical protein AV940_05715 [Alteromonas sp. Mac2]ANB22549.1 hypothetical protein A6K25_15500 [Alteromonas stellipolaris]
MKSNFEEKTYESYFNNELDRKSEIYFPPGQVLEGSLGFDSSSFSKNRRLWQLLGYPFWLQPKFDGVDLRKIADEMEYILSTELKNIPYMKANILVQYKRPEFITANSGKEWKYWKKPYFRYDIYKEQQIILNQIHEKFNSKVLVVYASPCTKDINELVRKRKDIIKHSNFSRAVDLNGHHRNTYVKSGTYSIACSEPSRIESLDITSVIEELGSSSSKEQTLNEVFISDFGSSIESVISQYKYLSESFGDLNENAQKVKDYKLFYNLLVMKNFREITGTQWIVKL